MEITSTTKEHFIKSITLSTTENPSTTNLEEHFATHTTPWTTVNVSTMKHQVVYILDLPSTTINPSTTVNLINNEASTIIYDHISHLPSTVENPTTVYSKQYHTASTVTVTTLFELDKATTTSSDSAKEKVVPDMPTTTEGTTMDVTDNDTTEIEILQVQSEHSMAVRLRETIAWVLMALFATLCSGLLAINITVLCIRKRRQAANLQASEDDANAYEMVHCPNLKVTLATHTGGRDTTVGANEIHGSTFYEATKVVETTDMEENLYEVM